MNTHTHTHGEWEVLRADRTESNETEGKDMAGCLANGDKVIAYFPTLSAMSNARLISAAPDLLAACKVALDAIRAHNFKQSNLGNCIIKESYALITAISKAERGEA